MAARLALLRDLSRGLDAWDRFDHETALAALEPYRPRIGASWSALLTALKSVVGSFTAHHAIVIGALFVVSVIFFPRGLVGYLAPALQRLWSRR